MEEFLDTLKKVALRVQVLMDISDAVLSPKNISSFIEAFAHLNSMSFDYIRFPGMQEKYFWRMGLQREGVEFKMELSVLQGWQEGSSGIEAFSRIIIIGGITTLKKVPHFLEILSKHYENRKYLKDIFEKQGLSWGFTSW